MRYFIKLKWIAAAIVAAASTQASAQQAQMAAGLGISTVGPVVDVVERPAHFVSHVGQLEMPGMFFFHLLSPFMLS